MLHVDEFFLNIAASCSDLISCSSRSQFQSHEVWPRFNTFSATTVNAYRPVGKK